MIKISFLLLFVQVLFASMLEAPLLRQLVPRLEGQQDSHAVRVGSVGPVQLGAVRHQPLVVEGREDALAVEAGGDDAAVVQVAEQVAHHDEFTKQNVHGEPGNDLPKDGEVAVVLGHLTVEGGQQGPQQLQVPDSGVDILQLRWLHTYSLQYIYQ